MRAARLSKTHAYEMYAIWELHACEMAYGRGTHMRYTPMRWPMREMHAHERHACGMASVRSMPMRDAPMRWPPMRWPMGEACL
jgi:hypothetical protein